VWVYCSLAAVLPRHFYQWQEQTLPKEISLANPMLPHQKATKVIVSIGVTAPWMDSCRPVVAVVRVAARQVPRCHPWPGLARVAILRTVKTTSSLIMIVAEKPCANVVFATATKEKNRFIIPAKIMTLTGVWGKQALFTTPLSA